MCYSGKCEWEDHGGECQWQGQVGPLPCPEVLPDEEVPFLVGQGAEKPLKIELHDPSFPFLEEGAEFDMKGFRKMWVKAHVGSAQRDLSPIEGVGETAPFDRADFQKAQVRLVGPSPIKGAVHLLQTLRRFNHWLAHKRKEGAEK